MPIALRCGHIQHLGALLTLNTAVKVASGIALQSSWNHIGSRSESIAENTAILCLLAVEHGLKVSVSVEVPLQNDPFCSFLSVISVCAFVVLSLRGFFVFVVLICLSVALEYNMRILVHLSRCYLWTEPFAFHLEQRVCRMVVPALLCHLPCWAPAVWAYLLKLNYWPVPYWPLSWLAGVALQS